MISGRPRAEAHRNCYRDLPRKTGRERVPPGRPAPPPQAADQAGPEGRAPRAAPPGAPARQALLCRLAAERAARAAGGGAWARVRWRRRPLGRGRPGGHLRQAAARQAVCLGRVRAEQLRLLRPDGGRLPQRRGLAAAGEPSPVLRRPAGRPGQPCSRRPGVLRLQHRQPGLHPSRRRVHRRRRDDRGPYSGARCASPPSAAGTTSAPSGRPADRLGAVGKDSSC